jgi:hypothetical protein
METLPAATTPNTSIASTEMNRRAGLKELIREKDEMEAEIERLTNYLTGPRMPGLTGGLVDKEGFPISDVSLIIAVREARGKLACMALGLSLSYLFRM